MKSSLYVISLFSILFLFKNFDASGCSTFMINNNESFLIGHNLDMYPDIHGTIYINKRGLIKESISFNQLFNGADDSKPRLNWTSRYGSVTYNPLGRELIDGGLNEVGLYIGEMSLNHKHQYPVYENKPKIAAALWLQYILDNYASVDEVIDFVDKTTIDGEGFNWHFFVCDKNANRAIIEFINGKTVIYKNDEVPVNLLCNNQYRSDLDTLKHYKGFGGDRVINLKDKSEDNRFIFGAHELYLEKQKTTEIDANFAFDVLNLLDFGITKWSVVFDARNKKMYYRTNLDADVKHFDFSSINFSCKEPVMMLDINKDLPSGDVIEYFIPYTKERNKMQIEKLFLGINGFKEKKNLPEIIERFANYPETVKCKDNSITTIKGKKITPSELDSFIESLMDSTNVPGLSIAIINDAKIVYHDVFGVTDITTKEHVDNYSLFEAASISKPLFAFFTMLQFDKGLLDLDKPLYEYLPYQDISYDDRYKLITARMILNHTSGFPNWRKDTLTIDFMPGQGFNYSGEGYDYLKMVLAHIRKVDDKGLDSIFNAEIVQPIGARNMYYTWNDYLKEHKVMGHKNGKTTDNGPQPPWKPNTFGPGYSLHTESVDYAKFICSIMNNVILRPETQKEMLKKQVDVPANHGFQKYGLSAWSLGFALETTTQGLRYNHSGDNGDFNSYCHFYKDYDYGIVFISNSDKLFTTDFTRKLLSFLDEETKL